MKNFTQLILQGIAAGSNSPAFSGNVHMQNAKNQMLDHHRNISNRIVQSITPRVIEIENIMKDIKTLQQSQIDVISPGQDEQIDKRIKRMRSRITQRVREIELQKELLRDNLQKRNENISFVNKKLGVQEAQDRIILDPIEKALQIVEDIIITTQTKNALEEEAFTPPSLDEIFSHNAPPSIPNAVEALGLGNGPQGKECTVKPHTREGHAIRGYTRRCP